PATMRAPRTMPCPVWKLAAGGTTPVGNDAIERAVAAVRSPGSKPAAVAAPRLTLDAYASFYAELSMWPEQVEEIRRRYQVPSRAAHEALDQEWRERVARDPAVGEALARRFGEDVAWWRRRWG